MGLSFSRCNEEQNTAVEKSPSVGDLRFKDSLPRHDYVQRLIEDFRQSSAPECMRRVIFSPDKILAEYVSASCHLPGAYLEYFPCPHCTQKNKGGRTSVVEIFHFANVHTPHLCATVKFTMPTDTLPIERTGCRVEVDCTKGCSNAPIAVDSLILQLGPDPSAVHIATDICIEVLRFLPRSELEKMLLVSRRWSHVIQGAVASLQQRHAFFVHIMFYGDSPGMLSVRFADRTLSAPLRILRVLTTRGLSQALTAVLSHLRNAFVRSVRPVFMRRVPGPDPPLEMLVDIPLTARVDWLKSLLRSMPPNSEIGSWHVSGADVGFDNLLTIASCALEQHMKLACVQDLQLGLFNRNATWGHLAILLKQPTTRAFSEITVSTTRVAIDTSALRDLLSSCQSLKLRIYVTSGAGPQDGLLTLPAQIIRDFRALRDANGFITEFSLLHTQPDNVAFSEMPPVNEATDRRMRFRFYIQGKYTVVRVSIYKNRATREHLTVVTIDHFRGTIIFLKGNVSLSDLKLAVKSPFLFY